MQPMDATTRLQLLALMLAQQQQQPLFTAPLPPRNGPMVPPVAAPRPMPSAPTPDPLGSILQNSGAMAAAYAASKAHPVAGILAQAIMPFLLQHLFKPKTSQFQEPARVLMPPRR